MTESIYLATSISETPIAVKYSEDLVDEKLLQFQEQVDTPVSTKTNKKSTASMRKFTAESQQSIQISRNRFEESSLHEAFRKKDVSKVCDLISSKKNDINELDLTGRSILYKCFLPENIASFINIVPFLLKNGANKNFCYGNESILHLALNNFTKGYGQYRIHLFLNALREILKAGAEINHRYLEQTVMEMYLEKSKYEKSNEKVPFL